MSMIESHVQRRDHWHCQWHAAPCTLHTIIEIVSRTVTNVVLGCNLLIQFHLDPQIRGWVTCVGIHRSTRNKELGIIPSISANRVNVILCHNQVVFTPLLCYGSRHPRRLYLICRVYMYPCLVTSSPWTVAFLHQEGGP